ncbi:MAG: sigma-70 family RNA polymerase sigma factor [Myxococcota bacterium]
MGTTSAAPSDHVLIEAARAGDRRALETLLARHQDTIYRFGVRMCANPDDAQDVLQDTMLAVARNLHSFRGASSFSTWVYAIARSFCAKRHRPGRSVRAADLDEEAAAEGVADPRRGPEDALLERRLQRSLEDAIAALEPMYRETLLLRDVEGLSAAETAEVLGLTVEAVKSRLHRARVAVRDAMAPALGTLDETPPTAACPDILTTLSRHLEGEISPAQCAQMEQHVQGCTRCRTACDSLKRTLALCRAVPAGPVPEPVQLKVRQALWELLARP